MQLPPSPVIGIAGAGAETVAEADADAEAEGEAGTRSQAATARFAEMAPRAPANGRSGSPSSVPNEADLITRLHTDALNTPTSLRGRLGVSRSSRPRANADSSSSDSDFASSKQSEQKPQHSRSMSNPFPSLFAGKKRQNSTELDAGIDNHVIGNQQNVKTHNRGTPSGGSKDFATGHCMTCASLVRWPKELKVFKCTICTTINDLVPLGVEGRGGSKRLQKSNHGSSSVSQPGPGSGPGPSSAPPISLEHTKRLVRTCLQSYLTQKLHRPDSETLTEKFPGDGPVTQDRLHPNLAIRHREPEEATNESRTTNTSHMKNQTKPAVAEGSTQTRDYLKAGPSHPPTLRSYSSSHPERSNFKGPLLQEPSSSHERNRSASTANDPKRIFKSLEDYIIDCFSSFECINSSFSMQTRQSSRMRSRSREISDSARRKPAASKEAGSNPKAKSTPREMQQVDPTAPLFDLDPKLLLLGDVAENGLWWTGGQGEVIPKKPPPDKEDQITKPSAVTKSPQLNWSEIIEWYSVINNAAENWFNVFEEISNDHHDTNLTEQELQALEGECLKGQTHTQRVLLKATEILLRRPGRQLTDPTDLRFLLIILENPHLHSGSQSFRGLLQPEIDRPLPIKKSTSGATVPNAGLLSGQHSGIVKRIVGLISNSSMDCHNQLISWMARYHSARFIKMKDFVSGFLTYRMIRQSEKKQGSHMVDVTDGLIPQMQAGRSGAYLHDAIGVERAAKKAKESVKKVSYSEDWQIRAASRVLALIFAANNTPSSRRDGTQHGGQFLPPSDFYTSMIDYADLVGDFESWESKRSKFSFCQYPFLMSIWAKTKILEYDAQRQMQSKARDAFFDSIMTRRNINQYLTLDVRRDCLVDDSLTAVSGVIGSGGEDLKKGLRITFQGEEGIDAGGLRKEWFLLLIREVFNPEYGMFIYDEDSQYCYFNPNSFEPSDQFFLVGVVMGLAIYNSTILDVALPPFAFRKLLASAPTPPGPMSSAYHRPTMKYTLDDLAEYSPRLARGLRQLLDYDGNVEETFCLDFVVETERYDSKVRVPLCPEGEHKAVTNSNRREYVDLYVRFILETAVKRQFEPFKRGFYTVCGGNAFSLFRPEEIELLVRGSDEPLDIASLRAVAEYDNWGNKKPDGTEPVVSWFWDSFQRASPEDQRKMLTFITGSDRIPAMGATSLTIKLSCLGDDCGRFPIARTCFNMLSLWRYQTRERLDTMLWRAVRESEGFGLK